MSLYTTNFIEFNITDLGNVMKNKTSCILNFPSNTTTVNKQQIVYPNPMMIKETDIVAQMNGFPLYGDQVFTFGPSIQSRYVMMGSTTNGAIFSNDGINWYPLGVSPIVSNTASGVFWDGTKWFGVVVNNSVYSYDGVNWTVTTPTIFNAVTGTGWTASYNGIIYLLVGYYSATSNLNIYYSYDGINWTTTTTQTGITTWCVKWNGFVWLMGTNNSTNTFMYSYNGITWTNVVNSTSNTTGLTICYDVAWIGDKWVAIGTNAAGTVGYIIYTKNYTGSSGWTLANSTIFTGKTFSLVWNGSILVALGVGTSDSIAYSYDGINWVANGKLIFTAPAGNGVGLWDGVKFILTGTGTNSIAYSYNGINLVGLGTALMTTPYTIGYNTRRPHSITFQRRLTIASGNGSANTLAYSLDGITWTGLGRTIFSVDARSTAWNGKIWIATGDGTNTLAFSNDGYVWTGLGNSIFSTYGSGAAWSNTLSIWVAVGAGTNTLAYSYDGMTWLTSSSSNTIQTTSGGLCVIWTGKLFVAGGGNASGNTLAYSSDGINWTGILAANGINTTVRTLATNGEIIIAGAGEILGGGYTGFYYSYDGIKWTSIGTSGMVTVRGIGCNGSMFVAVGAEPNSTSYSYDGINWTAGTNIFSGSGIGTGLGVCWNGTMWIAVGRGSNSIAYSYNGINWTSTTTNLFSNYARYISTNYQIQPKPYIQHPTIAMSSSITNNTINYSLDGLNWKGLSKSVFTVKGNKAFWSGSIWVAVGSGDNCIAYSYDGVNWTGTNQTIFNGANGGQGVCYNGNVWVAVGQGTNTIAYSSNGIQWTPIANSSQIFTNYGYSVMWNGKTFVATGSGSNTIATSTDGVTWQGSVTGTTFSTNGAGLWSNGPLWVATGTGGASIIYTTNTTGRTGWTATSVNPFTTGGNDVAWNGSIWVASGTGTGNTVATSTNGTTWTGSGLVVPTAGGGVCWNGVRWILTSNSSTPGNIMYSQNGTTWYSTGYTTTNSIGVTSNPGVGAFVAPSALFLDNNGINGNGIACSQTLDVISSDPYYQQGYDNVSITINPTYNPSLLQISTSYYNYLVPSYMYYAYSVRVLIPSYTGPVVRLIRSSDSAQSDFYTDSTQSYFTTGPKNTGTTFATWIGANTAYLKTWYDQSSYGNNASQSVLNSYPTISFQNNKYVIYFSNATTSTFVSLTTSRAPNTIFCQFYNTNTTYGTIICASNDFEQRFDAYTATLINGNSNSSDWYYIAGGVGSIKNAYNNGSPSTTVLLNGWNSLALTVTSTAGTWNFSKIGTDGFSNTRGLKGYMTEIIGHNMAMSTVDLEGFYKNRLL